MRINNVTDHANRRMQQRAIPEKLIPIIMSYGRETHAGDGALSVQIPKKHLKKMRMELKYVLDHLDSLSDVYLIVKEDTLITAAHTLKGRLGGEWK